MPNGSNGYRRARIRIPLVIPVLVIPLATAGCGSFGPSAPPQCPQLTAEFVAPGGFASFAGGVGLGVLEAKTVRDAAGTSIVPAPRSEPTNGPGVVTGGIDIPLEVWLSYAGASVPERFDDTVVLDSLEVRVELAGGVVTTTGLERASERSTDGSWDVTIDAPANVDADVAAHVDLAWHDACFSYTGTADQDLEVHTGADAS